MGNSDKSWTLLSYLIFGFNIIFFLFGLGLIIAGAVVQTKFKDYFDFLGGEFNGAAILLIIVGVIIFVVAFFGCCGAWKRSYCMLMIFSILLIVIFVLEIAGGIAAYVARNQVEQVIVTKMNEGMINYSDSEGVRKTWNHLQTELQCCGVTNYTDWQSVNVTTTGDVRIPRPTSCCNVPVVADNTNSTCVNNLNTINQDGCLPKFEEWVKGNILTVGGVGIAFGVLQIIGIILACCLTKQVKDE